MDNALISVVTRFGEPSKMDTAKFGTICKVSKGHDSFDVYLQISHAEEQPQWTHMGYYLSSLSDTDIYNDVHKVLLSKQLT